MDEVKKRGRPSKQQPVEQLPVVIEQPPNEVSVQPWNGWQPTEQARRDVSRVRQLAWEDNVKIMRYDSKLRAISAFMERTFVAHEELMAKIENIMMDPETPEQAKMKVSLVNQLWAGCLKTVREMMDDLGKGG